MNQFTIEAAWHPGFELVVSLITYLRAELHRVVDLGAPWRADVRRHLPRPFATRLQELSDAADTPALLGLAQELAWSYCDQAGTSAVDFLAWMKGLSIGDLYSILAKLAEPGQSVPANLPAIRDGAVDLLEQWYEHYFRGVDPRILSGLAAAAADLQRRIAAGSGSELLEEVSNGVVLQQDGMFERVALIPQYHARPWNIYGMSGRTIVHLCPVEALPPAAGEPAPSLTRLLRALDDGKRLAILRLVADHARTMTEIAAGVHLTKATVHYHLVLLRSAGLLRVETNLTKTQGNLYTLRRSALADLPRQIEEYLASPATEPQPDRPATRNQTSKGRCAE